MQSIEALWKTIEEWFSKNTELSLNLNEGASEEAIQKTEEQLNIKFPNDFREHLLLHDGQASKEDAQGIWMPGCGPLLSLKRMLKQWKLDREGDDDYAGTVLDEHVYQRSDPKRIPIAADPYGDGIISYLDLIPGPKGKEGQLITLVTECDYVVLDESFHKALDRYAQLLQTGELYWSEEEETLMMKNIEGTAEELAEAFALVK